jgi:hypothetical protein
MYLIAGQGGEESANDPHTGLGANAMSIVIVHGIERTRSYFMNLAIVEFFDGAFAFQTIAGFEVMLLPKIHFETGFKDAISQGHAHAILFVKKAQAMPLVAMGVAFGAYDIFKCFDNHSPDSRRTLLHQQTGVRNFSRMQKAG